MKEVIGLLATVVAIIAVVIVFWCGVFFALLGSGIWRIGGIIAAVGMIVVAIVGDRVIRKKIGREKE